MTCGLFVSHLIFLQELKDFSSICVTDTGALGGKLLGIVTPRETDFITDRSQPISEIMDK